MIADLVIDFDHHLKDGRVYLVELQVGYQDAPDDVPSSIDVDIYVIATSYYMAQYIANTMYPDVVSIHVYEEPITEYAYAARRNRSIL
jgi:hypothetical protein